MSPVRSRLWYLHGVTTRLDLRPFTKNNAARLKIYQPGTVALTVRRRADDLKLTRSADSRLGCCVLNPECAGYGSYYTAYRCNKQAFHSPSKVFDATTYIISGR